MQASAAGRVCYAAALVGTAVGDLLAARGFRFCQYSPGEACQSLDGQVASVSIDAKVVLLCSLNGVLTLRAASISSSAQCGLQLARTPFVLAARQQLCDCLHSNQLPQTPHTAARRRRERQCGAPPYD